MTTPSIFYGDEDYDLFITRSVAKAATRGCGLGLFSLKATPGDLTELTEEERAAADIWGRQGDDDRTQLDACVYARWAPGDPFGNLSELDDPESLLRRPEETTEAAPASESGAMLLAGRAVGDGLAAGLRRDRFDEYRRRYVESTPEPYLTRRRQLPNGDYHNYRRLAGLPTIRPTWTQAHPELRHMQGRCLDVFISSDTRHPLCMRDRAHDGPHCSLTDEQREEISRVDLEHLEDFSVRGTIRPALNREPYWVWTT